MDALIARLGGFKTYAVAFGMIIISGLKAQGYISQEVYEVLFGLLSGAGLMALRAGVSKAAK